MINRGNKSADPVTQTGSMDYPGGHRELAFGYNGWGALVRDESRGITDISYDGFGNPLRISYSDEAIEQTTAYYPCGGIFADLWNPAGA